MIITKNKTYILLSYTLSDERIEEPSLMKSRFQVSSTTNTKLLLSKLWQGKNEQATLSCIRDFNYQISVILFQAEKKKEIDKIN